MLCYSFSGFFILLQLDSNFHFCLLQNILLFCLTFENLLFTYLKMFSFICMTFTGHFLKFQFRSEIKSEFRISTRLKHLILSFDHLEPWMTGHIIDTHTFVCVNFCCIKNPDELFFCMLAIILLTFFWYLLFEPISMPSPFLFSYVVEKRVFYCLFSKYLEFWEIAGACAPSAISRA